MGKLKSDEYYMHNGGRIVNLKHLHVAEDRITELEAQVAALTEERESAYWHGHAEGRKEVIDEGYKDLYERAEAEAKRLREALAEYGYHNEDCAFVSELHGDCDCGYCDTMEALAATTADSTSEDT